MSKTVTIKDPKQLPSILDVIHDRWFKKDEIVFDPGESVLSIKFTCELPEAKEEIGRSWLWKKFKVPLVECDLRFHKAKSYRIDDKVQVGTYDFNDITYDPELGRISISTGVPLDIEIIVEEFEVSLERTDHVVDVKIETSICC